MDVETVERGHREVEAAPAGKRFVKVNGLYLHYLEFGDPRGPALVCLHGLNGSAHAFDQIAPKLAERYRVVALDMRGHGDSHWAAGAEYSVQDYLTDLNKFLAIAGIERLSLIGSSLGGIVAMLFAANQTGRVERLLLNDIGPEINPVGLQNAAARPGLTGYRFANLSEAIAHYRRSYPPAASLPRPVIAQLVRNSVRTTEAGHLCWKLDPDVNRLAVKQDHHLSPERLWWSYRRIKARVLVVRGAQSDILARDTVAKMRAVLPGSDAIEVPAIGHAPWLSEPAALEALRNFLD